MTKKDYLRAVKTIQFTNSTESEFQMLIDTFVEFFEGDNPRFNKERFRKACQDEDS